ncbi:MAG: hypothetical protein ACOCTG_00110 [Bacteroidota bacterium]
MKASASRKSEQQKRDHTRLYFNVFMGLLALSLLYMILLVFTI